MPTNKLELVFFTEINVEWTGVYYAVHNSEFESHIKKEFDRRFSIVDSALKDTFHLAITNYFKGVGTTIISDNLTIIVDKSLSFKSGYKIITMLN